MLNVIHHASGGNAPPLLIAHGLYGSGRNWGVIAKRLSDRGPVMAVDMRNHGASPWFSTHSYQDMAADLAEVIEVEADGPIDVLGHSMGGKASMVLALTRPELVRRLVGRGTEGPEERARRLRTAKVELAAQSEFDHVIVNDDVRRASEELVSLMRTPEH